MVPESNRPFDLLFRRMVGIAPIHHGTTLSGIATIAKALSIFDPAQPIVDFFAPSFYEMGMCLILCTRSLAFLSSNAVRPLAFHA